MNLAILKGINEMNQSNYYKWIIFDYESIDYQLGIIEKWQEGELSIIWV